MYVGDGADFTRTLVLGAADPESEKPLARSIVTRDYEYFFVKNRDTDFLLIFLLEQKNCGSGAGDRYQQSIYDPRNKDNLLSLTILSETQLFYEKTATSCLGDIDGHIFSRATD